MMQLHNLCDSVFLPITTLQYFGNEFKKVTVTDALLMR